MATRIVRPVPSGRQHAFMEQAATVHQADRRRRLGRLRAKSEAIATARDAYAALERPESSVSAEVRVRPQFVRLARPRQRPPGPPTSQLRWDLATRPPLTKLVHRDSHALAFFLSALFVAHGQARHGRAFQNEWSINVRQGGKPHWAALGGLSDPGLATRARRARVTRALDELAKADLVEFGSGQGKYEGFSLRTEDGDGRRYWLPGERDGNILLLPASFFTQAWHLVLKPREIVMLLAVLEHHRRLRSRGSTVPVALPMLVRDTEYGISGEVYGSIHELEEFGLIEIHDPMPNRRRGKIRKRDAVVGEGADPESSFEPLPYQLLPLPDQLNREALSTVVDCLTESSVPPRLNQP